MLESRLNKVVVLDSFLRPGSNSSRHINNKKSAFELFSFRFIEEINHSFDNGFLAKILNLEDDYASRGPNVEANDVGETLVKAKQNLRSFQDVIKNLLIRRLLKPYFFSPLDFKSRLTQGFNTSL